MCGRYTLATAPEALARIFELDDPPELPARYNIAPTQQVPAVRLVVDEGSGASRRRVLRLLRWGLVPFWAKDPGIGARMINARAETVADKPAFRAAFRRRRCLVLADGFYEWQRVGRGAKQPFLIRLRDGGPFAFAGLWERWTGPEGEPLESCTLLTTQPNELVAPIHNRMPVILDPADYDAWLDPQLQDPAALRPLLRAFPAEKMIAHPVSQRVNNPRVDEPGCAAPLPDDDG
jgi:putative SOS response-associated peptidase YedK